MFNIRKSETYSWDAVNNISKEQVEEFISLLQNQLNLDVVNPIVVERKSLMEFEIADKSTEKRLTWYDAQDYVKTLGNGWRLPSLNELDLMYQNENNLNSQGYWSSTEFDIDHAWIQYFATGNHSNLNKNGYYYIRAIRDL